MDHIPKTYLWQTDLIKKYKDVKFSMMFTGEEQQGYKVVDRIEASFMLPDGTMQFEYYNLQEKIDYEQ